MTSVTFTRWNEKAEKLLQSLADLHKDRPEVCKRLLQAVEMLWVDTQSESRPKTLILEALLSVLRYCGDFELQCFALKGLVNNEDVIEYGTYFTEVWFKDEPHMKPSFTSLIEEPNDENLRKFLCKFNSSSNIESGRGFQFVYSIPISFVFWNSCHLNANGKSLPMLHLNLGSKCLSINGVANIPILVDIRGYMVLQGKDIVEAKVSDLRSLYGPVIQGLSIWTTKGQLVVHPEPALPEIMWADVKNFLLYISSTQLQFTETETIGTQTEPVAQQVPSMWQVSSSQDDTFIPVEDEEIDMDEVNEDNVQENCEGAKNDPAQSILENQNACAEALIESVGASARSDSEVELGFGVNNDRINIISNTGQIFSDNETLNTASDTLSSSSTPRQPEVDAETMKDSGGPDVKSYCKLECRVSMNFDKVDPVGHTSQTFSENAAPNINDGIHSSDTLGQVETDPEAMNDSVGSGVRINCELELRGGMNFDQADLHGNSSQSISEVETSNTTISDTSCASTYCNFSSKGKNPPQRGKYIRKRGRGGRGGRGCVIQPRTKGINGNRPARRRISRIKTPIASTRTTRSSCHRLANQLSGSESPLPEKEEYIGTTEHPLLLPVLYTSTSKASSVAGHEATATSIGTATFNSMRSMSPGYQSAAVHSLPNLLPTPATSPKSESSADVRPSTSTSGFHSVPQF